MPEASHGPPSRLTGCGPNRLDRARGRAARGHARGVRAHPGAEAAEEPVFGTSVDEVFSPVCDCGTETAAISFRLRKRDRLDVAIVDGGEVVRTLERATSRSNGPVELEWDGRDDAGNVLPEGDYRPRVHLQRERSTITLPNPIMRIDVTPPVVEAMTVAPRVISPDGDGRADRAVVRYRLDETARGVLFVNGDGTR